MKKLAERAANRELNIDSLVIETSGTANPAQIAQTLLVDDICKKVFVLDAVVTVVDAKHIESYLDQEQPESTVNESQKQLAFADRIVINKMDLLPDEEDLARVEERVREINEFARIVRCERCNVPLDNVLNLRAFTFRELPAQLRVARPTSIRAPEETKHDGAVSSIGIDIPQDVDLQALQEWVNCLLVEKANDMYRMKGVIAVDGVDQRYVYHAVNGVAQSEFIEPWDADEQRGCKLIIIGRDLDQDVLQEEFNKCLATPENKQKRIDNLRFGMWDRVQCKIGNEWSSGAVVAHYYRDPSFPLGFAAPYQVKLDTDDTLVYAPADDDKVIRKEELRFPVGHHVQCMTAGDTGRLGWSSGVVVGHHYRDPSFPIDFTAPYQVKLDVDGTWVWFGGRGVVVWCGVVW